MSGRKFQSTRPSRASTGGQTAGPPAPIHFNPQGPHGPRLTISTIRSGTRIFQSTRPSRAATGRQQPNVSWNWRFQSTRPSRASTVSSLLDDFLDAFQSTRPSRASTRLPVLRLSEFVISIHKALTGLDVHQFRLRPQHLYFNPQGPHGPRQRNR